MHLKRNKESWEINDLEMVEKFLVSEYFQNCYLDLGTRLALFIAAPEPKGLNSICEPDEFIQALDLVYLQIRIKGIKNYIVENRVKKKYKTKRMMRALSGVYEL